MCVIIHKNKNDILSAQTIKDAWTVNPDGAGYCYWDELDQAFYYRKGIMHREQLINELNNFKDCELIVHFRIATSGHVNTRQTHPFLITDNLIETKTPSNASKNLDFHRIGQGQALLMHNGIISGLGTKEHSDTMHLARLLSSVKNENDRIAWLELINGKFVYISNILGINLIGDYEIDDETGLMCSNLNHCFYYQPKIYKANKYGYDFDDDGAYLDYVKPKKPVIRQSTKGGNK